MATSSVPRRQSVLAALTAVVSPSPGSPEQDRAARRAALRTPVAPRVEKARTATADEPVSLEGPSFAEIDAAYPRRNRTIASTTTTRTVAAVESPGAVRHLARRASWGATPELLAEITRVGTTAWIDAQLDPVNKVPDTAMDDLVATQWPRLRWQTWEVHDKYWPDSTGDLGMDLLESYLARALWSKRQLLEVMVDFWANHLVVTAPWGETWDSAHRFHIDVVRRHALGRYADMLVAAAKHPALLKQLDAGTSTKRAPNENFGRELLELHTVGVEAGYPESDIRRSAFLLTGLSYDDESGEYQYRRIRHYRGQVSLLGWTNPNTSADGEPVTVSYLTHLARHPRTARRIATKLAVRFVSDTPPTTLVDRLAQVYTANDTRIAPVLRALLTSAEFKASGGLKVKRPLENMVSTCRVLGVRPGADTKGWLRDFVWNSKVAGQQPMGWPAPNGYPDVAGAWAGSGAMLATWNWHMSQGWEAGSSTPRVTYPAFRSLLPSTLPTTYGPLVDALATRLLGAPLATAKRDAVCAFLDKTATSSLRSTDAVLGWRLPYVVALVLDSPEFATR